jgi:hypothetical protein
MSTFTVLYDDKHGEVVHEKKHNGVETIHYHPPNSFDFLPHHNK